jgi:hypothetical protein
MSSAADFPFQDRIPRFFETLFGVCYHLKEPPNHCLPNHIPLVNQTLWLRTENPIHDSRKPHNHEEPT